MNLPAEMDGLPRVTIGIPTYNRGDTYLPLTLESALAQSYRKLEILVCDNASTDRTPSLVTGIEDPRLRYIRHSSNIGPNANYNSCLEQARGDYFVLLHDDDLLDPDFVESCLRRANYTTDAGMIRTGVRVIDDGGRVLRESENEVAGLELTEFILAWFTGKTAWYLVNTLFHTRRLKECGGFRSPYRLSEDGFAIARLAARYPRFDVREIKSSFRVHAGELTFAAKAAEWAKEYLDLLNCLCELLPPEGSQMVRKKGMRFFARLSYNRAAAIRSRPERFHAYFEIFRLFHYRYLPYHRIKSLALAERAWRGARRRAQHVLRHA